MRQALGFKGSGQHFALPSDSHWALLGIQRSAWGTAQAVRFTLNFTVVSKRAWEALRTERSSLGERPSPNIFYGGADGIWHRRIGRFLPEGKDHWWELPAGSATNAVAAQVVAAVRDFALPEMMRQIEAAPGSHE